MLFTPSKKIALLAFLPLLSTHVAYALEDTAPSLDNTGFFIAAALGKSSYDLGSSSSEIDVDDSDTGYTLTIGYSFNEYFALETGYVDLGAASMKLSESFSDANYNMSYSSKAEMEVSGLTLAFTGTLPLTDHFALNATVGMLAWDGDLTSSGDYSYSDTSGYYDNDEWSGKDSADGTDMFWAAGMSYQFNNFALSLNYNTYDIEGDDISLLNLGGKFYF